MTFVSYYVPSILTSTTDFMTRFQIRMEDEERRFWQEYANRYFRGNLAKMIRTFVTQQIMSGDLEKDSELPDEIVDAIIEIKTKSNETTETVGSFQSDLIIMKSLLTQIIDKPVVSSNYDNNRRKGKTKQIKASPEDKIKKNIRQFLEESEEYVELDEVVNYLKTSKTANLDESDEFTISIFLDEIREELFVETKEKRFTSSNGGNQYDF